MKNFWKAIREVRDFVREHPEVVIGVIAFLRENLDFVKEWIDSRRDVKP